MEGTTFQYQKKRLEFGRQCLFSDKGPDLIDNYRSDRSLTKQFILKDPVDRSQQCAPIQAEHHLNTMRAEYTNTLTSHVEGGWPKDVNKDDEEQTKRFRRKIEKDEGFYHTMMQLFKSMENCIYQNNAVNIYQQYFADVEPTPLVERCSGRTLNAYHDQCTPTRPITHISWSPDNQTKIATSHCNMDYQANVPNETTFSYIWEVENPNKPLMILKPEYPVVCLEYHQKDPHSLVSGHINGQVGIWDTRKGYEPVELSLLENSYRDPVHNVIWMNSKSGTEFFGASTDGTVKWWDLRKLSEPTDVLIFDYCKEEEQLMSRAQGITCLEYEPTIPTRFSVGTEDGMVVSCNRKGKTAMEKMAIRLTAHLGPVLALQRNPGFVKNFLSIGDWCSKIWAEDCRESAIMWTNFHEVQLTDGAWSPTRLSVFFTTRSDGVLDVWDILQQQDQAVLNFKLCDEPLQCLRTHEMGRLVAVGNKKGSLYLVQFTENLSVCNKNDKPLLTAMFEREGKREKILEARNREFRLKQKGAKKDADTDSQTAIEDTGYDETVFFDNQVKQAEEEFNQLIEKLTNPPPPPKPETEEEKVVEEVSEPVPPPPDPEPENDKEKEKEKKKGKGKKKK